MTQIKLDKVILTNLVETYLNYDTLASNILISGNLAAGATQTFSTTIPYVRGKTRADLYARNTTTNIKRPVTGGARQHPYTYAGAETCDQGASYDGTNITVSFTIRNGTGAVISLTSQTMEISAVLYEVPY